MFAEGMPAPEVAAVLEVSTKAAYEWRRAWAAGGAQALASKGPPGPQPTLSQAQVDQLERRLEHGTAAAGYTDQRWTLARVAELITTMFGHRLSLQTVAVLERCQVRVTAVTRGDTYLAGCLSWWFARWRS
jgi:putative transposase